MAATGFRCRGRWLSMWSWLGDRWREEEMKRGGCCYGGYGVPAAADMGVVAAGSSRRNDGLGIAGRGRVCSGRRRVKGWWGRG